MRLAVDTVIALMLLGTIAGIGWHRHQESVRLRQVEAVQASLRAIQTQAMYHAGLADTDLSTRGYPLIIQTGWFDAVPQNPLADEDVSWMDQATEEERDWWDPRRITAQPGLAAYWYNPYRGIVRARVARQTTDRATTELYNLVNGTSLEPDQVIW